MGNSNSSSRARARTNSLTASTATANVALALRRRSFRRSSLSKDLEQFASPTGLYPTCPWDARAARRLVVEKKIGPRVPGRESKDLTFGTECPICFLFYPDGSVNTTTCCKKPMCSECYLQIKPPKKHISCPYCNHENLSVKYSMPADLNLAGLMMMTAVTEALMSPSSSLSSATPATPEPTVLANVASVEERAQLEENLRSQLHLSSQPIRSSSITSPGSDAGFVTEPQYFFASSADAARLEEMMLMEAIRRSMQDVTIASKPNEEAGEGRHADDGEHDNEHQHEDDEDIEYQYSVSDEDDGEEGDYDTLRPSQITLSNSTSGSRPSPCWNPFD